MPKKSSSGIDGAKAEVTKSRVQTNRIGKRLIGAYIKEEDIKTFQAILKARGTNVQDFFTQVVEKQIAGANGPSALERLIDQRIARFHATRKPTPGG